jgi:hypothetical protein
MTLFEAVGGAMRRLHRSPRTEQAYLHWIREFCGGGACPACGFGLQCATASDCAYFVCSGGVCQGPSCSDGVKNGSETDVDCGGDCAPCATGQSWVSPATACASTTASSR